MTWYLWVWGVISTVAAGVCGLAGFAFLVEAVERRGKSRTTMDDLNAMRVERDRYRKAFSDSEDMYLKERALRAKLEKKQNEFGLISP